MFGRYPNEALIEIYSEAAEQIALESSGVYTKLQRGRLPKLLAKTGESSVKPKATFGKAVVAHGAAKPHENWRCRHGIRTMDFMSSM